MAKDFIPRPDAHLLSWSRNLAAKLDADSETYGIAPGYAAAYRVLHEAFEDSYGRTQNPDTRTTGILRRKDQDRADLVAYARTLSRIAQAHPTITNEQRISLGLTVPRTRSTVPFVPATAPAISIVSVVGHTVRIRLSDPDNPTRRAKPEGVIGAVISTFVGDTPTPEAAWNFQGTTGRTTVEVTFPTSVPVGARVWFTAQWFGESKQVGPASPAAGTYIAHAGAMTA